MELSILKKPNLVVAIDIGSTYSGYAWQWRKDFLDNRSNVEFNTNWGSGSLQLHKTSTCVLLDKDYKVNSFGYQAETRYCNFCDEENEKKSDVRGKWFLFKRFKLVLYHKNFKEDIVIEDYLGQQLPILDVMSKMIGALKDHFIKNLKDKGHTVNMAETLWVVTVPAIWSDKAKGFMRDAAERSGISKKHLLLANEPESAALYCMHLPSEQKQEMNNFGGKGDKFLTVDMGGGTLDILAIEVLDDGNVKEICAGVGSRVGGQDVNNAFFQSCKDVIEGNAWHETFTGKHSDDLLLLEKDFEDKKVQIGSGDAQDEKIHLNLPESMKEMLSDGRLSIKPGCDKSKYFKIDRKRLMFDSALVRETLFEETVKLVLDTLTTILDQKEIKDIRTVVLVGGFAESSIVIGKIREFLADKYGHIKVVVPTSPFRAVLKGAVLYGHDPLIFRSRISRATFGVATNELFDIERHDESKKWRHEEDGKDYCRDVFHIHVRKDQSVVLNEKQPTSTYLPMYKLQREMGLSLYASSTHDPKYTTDEGCKEIGKINVDLSDTSDGNDREVKVQMIYGGTELSVIATDEMSGKEYPANIKFDDI